ncbi:MAG: ATP-binding protein [Proteobacteria bacterium]|nr:ATP-binding protein [Pseudomonadota bacterium]
MTAKQKKATQTDAESFLQQITNLKNELILEKELVKKLKQTQEDWGDLIEKVQPTIQALSEKIKELKINLHLKNQELNNVLQSLSHGLIVTDLKGSIQTFNRAAVSMTGITREDAIGSYINDLFEFTVIPEESEKKRIEAIENEYQQQFNFRLSQKEEKSLKSTTTLMRSDDNELQGIIVNLMDITQLKRLEEEAERKNRLTAMGEIAMQVAHELRNPLGSIELFVSMMKMDLDADSEEMSLAMHINSATRSMNHIISNLLEYTKPRPIVLDDISLHEMLEEFVEFSEFSAQQLNIEIISKLKAKPDVVLGNKELLKQVFHNLFVNACQAMPEGGELDISTKSYLEKDPLVLQRLNNQIEKTSMPAIKVKFKDIGKGMTEEIKKKIFDPFYTTREQGTGLGLSIVHNTMASHGGTIIVKSKIDKGTEITLVFPRRN